MKIHNRFLSILSFLVCAYSLSATDCNIHLMTIPMEQGESVPADVNDMLITRLTTAITADGVTASPDADRFFVTGKITHLYKEILPGPPINHIMHSTLTLYIGDNILRKVYASATFELRGAGTSESRAFVNAFQLLNHQNDKLRRFINQGTQKILSYYNDEYPSILAQARRAGSLQQYEEALWIATSIPECCNGYDEAERFIISTYDKYIDHAGRILISKARAVWATSPDSNGAQKAYEYLSRIDPDATCYTEATALHNEIKKTVKEIYDFETKEKYQNHIDIKRRKIDAAKAIGVAFGNGQKETTTNLIWLK